MKKTIVTIGLLITFQCAAYAQYTFQPLQRGFERTIFFGKPHNIIPGYYGDLAVSFLGAIDDPFLNLALNPALLPKKEHYVYASYKTPQAISTHYGPIQTFAANFVSSYYNGRDSQWHIAQPSATVAYLGKPFNNSNIFVGFAYQSLYFKDNYYPVSDKNIFPQSNLAALNTVGVSRTNSKGNMLQTGHFFTAWAGYAFEKASVGLKINRSLFSRTGRREQNYGCSYCITILDVSSVTAIPFSDGIQSRKQNYAHWDVSVGVDKDLNEKFSMGTSLGVVISEATQNLNRNTSDPYYPYSSPVIDEFYFYTNRNNSLKQSWSQDGDTWYGSLHGNYKFNETSGLTFSYRFSQFANDVSFASLDARQFLLKRRNPTNPDTATVTFIRTGHSNQTHQGGGQMINADHHLTLIMNKDLNQDVKAYFGVQFGYLKRNYDTSEQVQDLRFNFSSTTYTPSGFIDSTQFRRTVIKDLRWKQDGYLRTFRIPVMLKIKANDWLAVDFGASPVFVKHHYFSPVFNDFQIYKIVVGGDVEVKRNFSTHFKNTFNDYEFKVPAFIGFSMQPSALLTVQLSVSTVLRQDDGDVYDISTWQGFLNLVITP